MAASKPDGKSREGGQRNVLTSIYYCLTTDSPRQWWAHNMSDHIHYWHGGGSLTYHVVHPDGRYERHVLGPRADRGETMQLTVRGGSFKCAHLEAGCGDFVLLGEAVAPGRVPPPGLGVGLGAPARCGWRLTADRSLVDGRTADCLRPMSCWLHTAGIGSRTHRSPPAPDLRASRL